MKRCPQCNRVENDEALKFCRVDGATLANDSSSFAAEAGTVQLGSVDASEIHTSILPHNTQANVNRATGPTTYLPSQQSTAVTGRLSKKPRPKVLIAAAAVLLMGAIAAAYYIALEDKYIRREAIGQNIAAVYADLAIKTRRLPGSKRIFRLRAETW